MAGGWRAVSRLPLEDVWFPAADGARLFGWYVEAAGTNAVLLWCHGNGGNIIHRLENLKRLYQLGLSVFLFDYRGYGKSQGLRPTESGLYQDALGAYDYLVRRRNVQPERLVIFGRSLGASVARPRGAKTGGGIDPGIAILASGRGDRPALLCGLPVHWLLGAEFRLIDRLPHLLLPKLIIHGDQDKVIPIEFGREVFEAAKPPKEWYVIPGAGHNDTYLIGGGLYFRRLTQFIHSVLRG